MKWVYLIISISILWFSFSGCYNNSISEIEIQPKKKFSEEEVLVAKKFVKKELKDFFKIGYEMKKFYCDEIETSKKGENIIVLISEFKTDSSFKQKDVNSFAPNTYYEQVWILERDNSSGEWKIKSFGFE